MSKLDIYCRRVNDEKQHQFNAGAHNITKQNNTVKWHFAAGAIFSATDKVI